MFKKIVAAGLVLASLCSCKMENPLLVESTAPYGAPMFDKIKTEHYLPAFEQAIAEGKAEIDAIVNNPEAPTFENTIEAMEYAGGTLTKVAGIFFNVNEANTSDEMQKVAEEITPMLNDYSMYVSLNIPLFERVKAVYEQKDNLSLEPDQMKLLENAYKGFSRSGANLSDEDKELYRQYSNELSLLTLQFGKNVLAATNAFVMNITDEAELAGLPEYVKQMASETAAEKGLTGWAFTLDVPSYLPFMKYSENEARRKELYLAYATRGIGEQFDNTQVVKDIVGLRIKIANLLGYETYAEYALEDRMANDKDLVINFLGDLSLLRRKM